MTTLAEPSSAQWFHGVTAERLHREAELLAAGCPLPVRARCAWARAFPRINSSLLVVEGGGKTGALGFEKHASRALSGHHIGRVFRAGASLPTETAAVAIGAIVTECLRDSRVLRVHFECFSRNEDIRMQLGVVLREHGFEPISQPTHYGYTLTTNLAERDNASHLNSFSQGVRQNIRALSRYPVELRPILDVGDSSRMNILMVETLARTGARHVDGDYAPLINFAREEPSLSRLVGVYRTDSSREDALIAFACGLNNVDHVAYDIGASARVDDFKNLSLGYPLLWDLIVWARELGVGWFDYGGVPAKDSEDVARLGRISDFKRRFEKQIVPIAEEWVLTTQPLRSAAASGLSRMAKFLRNYRGG